jgi:hypothetical protein
MPAESDDGGAASGEGGAADGSDAQQAEIYTYASSSLVYAMNWSVSGLFGRC